MWILDALTSRPTPLDEAIGDGIGACCQACCDDARVAEPVPIPTAPPLGYQPVSGGESSTYDGGESTFFSHQPEVQRSRDQNQDFCTIL